MIQELLNHGSYVAAVAMRRLPAFLWREPETLRPFGTKESGLDGHLDAIRRLRERFGPTRAGQADALRGDPHLDLGQQSGFEYGVVVAFQAEIDRQRELAERGLRHLDIDLKRLPATPEIDPQFSIARVDVEQDSALRSWREPLVESKREALRSKRVWTSFRQDNPRVLFRAVQYPNRTVALISILAVWCVEVALSFNLLITAGSRTASEVFTLVFMTASINLALGLLGVGYIGARNVAHAKIGRKLLGGAILVGTTSALLLLHLALAHYRNALDIVRADPVALANAEVMLQRLAKIPISIGQTIRSDPFAFIGDLQATVVFFTGIGFAAIAAITGYRMLCDPYPGYQEADQIYRNATQTSEFHRQSFEQAIARTVTDAKAALGALISAAEQRLSTVKASIDAAVDITHRYEEAVSTIEHTMLQIIDEYRCQYRRTRDNAGPAQWQDEPRLNRDASFGLDNLVQIEERETANLAGLRNRTDELQTRLTMNQTLLIERVKTYLEAIDQDAQHDEEIARANLLGVRTPGPPSMGPGE